MIEPVFNTPVDYYGRFGNADLYIKRDDRILFTYGTKVRKYQGYRNYFKEKKIREITLFGNLHSNFLAVFSWLARNDGLHVNTVCYSRNIGLQTANRFLAEKYTNSLKLFSSREEALPASEIGSGYVLPEFGMSPLALEGLESLWEEIAGAKDKFDILLLDAGSGLTLISALNTGYNLPEIAAVAIGSKPDVLEPEIAAFEKKYGLNRKRGYSLYTPAVLPGYARTNKQFKKWIKELNQGPVVFEPVYAGKTLYTFFQMAASGEIGGKVLYLHQGGQLNHVSAI